MDIIEQVRAALARHLDATVHVVSRREWDDANGPGGRPTLMPRPLSPFRAVQDSDWFMSAVVSGRPFAETPGSHVVRSDPGDDPDVINTDSHDWILDLPSDPAWPRVVAISGITDTPEVRDLVRQHAFGVHVFRADHHHPTVPDDIARATPKDAPPA